MKQEAVKKISKISDAGEYSGQAMKRESRIVALEQDRNKMNLIIRGSIQQCKTGEVLSRFEQDDTDVTVLRNAEIIAGRIVGDIDDQMICGAGTSGSTEQYGAVRGMKRWGCGNTSSPVSIWSLEHVTYICLEHKNAL